MKDAGFAIPDYERTPGGGFLIFARITPELKSVLPPERMEPQYTKNPAAPGGRARLDWALCQWMAEEKGRLCIPSSPFFSREKALKGASHEFIWVAFCKTDKTIARTADALSGLKSSVEKNALALAIYLFAWCVDLSTDHVNESLLRRRLNPKGDHLAWL